MRYLIAAILLALSAPVAAQHYYQPDQPGHGLTVQAVGSGYVAQWYVHDGDRQRWVSSDVCEYGEPCPVYAVDANGFPAVGAKLVEAGHITLDRDGDGLLLTYDLFIEQEDCADLMVGPLPPECRDADGNRLWDAVIQPGLDQSGSVELELLVD
jgi:hypothetical protein